MSVETLLSLLLAVCGWFKKLTKCETLKMNCGSIFPFSYSMQYD